jgi:two-component system, response regulator
MLSRLGDRVVFIYADDDPDDHALLRDAIKSSSLIYELWSVYNGEELINFLRENAFELQPAFLIVDLNMPRMDGFTAIKQIRSKLMLASIPVFLLSTSRNDEDKQKAKELGVAGFYTKPVKTNDLKDIIDEMTLKASKHIEK